MIETVLRGRDNPCKGCPDRYSACSDHCKKLAFLKWKAEQEKIRKARQKQRDLDTYVSGEIRKNRRVK